MSRSSYPSLTHILCGPFYPWYCGRYALACHDQVGKAALVAMKSPPTAEGLAAVPKIALAHFFSRPDFRLLFFLCYLVFTKI